VRAQGNPRASNDAWMIVAPLFAQPASRSLNPPADPPVARVGAVTPGSAN